MADPLSKWATTLGLIAAGIWTLTVYRISRKHQIAADKLAAQQKFLDTRLQIYIEAADCAATIAVSTDKEAVQKAAERFWILYWGRMAVVEDDRVEDAMVQFSKVLENPHRSDDLSGSALDLAHACRDSIGDSWEVEVATSGSRSSETVKAEIKN